MGNRIKVCHDCTERYPACHDHCKKYKEAREKAQAEKDLIFQKKSKDFAYADYKRKKFKKYKRQI